jgi:hypothetical protein
VTVKDWGVDASIILTHMKNPLWDDEQNGSSLTQQSKEIGVHRGFHSYLLKSRKHQDGDGASKYDTILEYLRSLLEQNEGYRVVTCGHSLGGALATLFAFCLACEEDVPKPVTCIMFASPRVGNTSFKRAFQELEKQGKIVCVRVANQNDVIPRVPHRLAFLPYPETIYRHVGVEIRLFRSKRKCGSSVRRRLHQLRYKRLPRTRSKLLVHDVIGSTRDLGEKLIMIPLGCCTDNYLANHSCLEYMERLEAAGDSFEFRNMEDVPKLYNEDMRKSTIL